MSGQVEFAAGSRSWSVFPRRWGVPPNTDVESPECRGWLRANAKLDADLSARRASERRAATLRRLQRPPW